MKPKHFEKCNNIHVTVGESFNLSCKALVGKNDMDETLIYWMSDYESLDLSYKSIT